MKGYKFRKHTNIGLIKDKPKEELRLMRWMQDGCPPIDMNNEYDAIFALMNEIRILRKKLEEKPNE